MSGQRQWSWDEVRVELKAVPPNSTERQLEVAGSIGSNGWQVWQDLTHLRIDMALKRGRA